MYNPFKVVSEEIRQSYDPTKGKMYYPACDEGHIKAHYASIIEYWQKGSPHVPRFNLSPSPFLGNPLTAEIVILSLNPGFGDCNIGGWDILTQVQRQQYRNIEADAMMLCSPDFGTTVTNQVFQTMNGIYWLERLRPLMDAKGYPKGSPLELAALNKFALIDWFPYHSKLGIMSLGAILPSQQWIADEIMPQVLANAKMIVIARAVDQWQRNVSGLSGFQNLYQLNSNRVTVFSQGNMPLACWNNILSII